MSQLGEVHQMMWRQMEWADAQLQELRKWLEPLVESDAPFILETARTHLGNALRLAEQIDSGVVYRIEESGV